MARLIITVRVGFAVDADGIVTIIERSVEVEA